MELGSLLLSQLNHNKIRIIQCSTSAGDLDQERRKKSSITKATQREPITNAFIYIYIFVTRCMIRSFAYPFQFFFFFFVCRCRLIVYRQVLPLLLLYTMYAASLHCIQINIYVLQNFIFFSLLFCRFVRFFLQVSTRKFAIAPIKVQIEYTHIYLYRNGVLDLCTQCNGMENFNVWPSWVWVLHLLRNRTILISTVFSSPLRLAFLVCVCAFFPSISHTNKRERF